MATRPNKEFNSLLKMKKSMASLAEDIKFLKLCLKNNITPRSHRIKITPSLPGARKEKNLMEKKLLRNSIKSLYGKLDLLTLRTYESHLELGKQKKGESGDNLYETLRKIQRGYECEKERKRRILHRKMQKLLRESKKKTTPVLRPTVQHIPNFVVNRSTQDFTKEQQEFLNNGLNYAIDRHNIPKEDIIMDIEAAIKFIPEAEKAETRKQTTKLLKSIEMKKGMKKGKKTKELKIIKELKSKPVFYIKADKGNSVVIMNKEEYDENVKKKLAEGNFQELRKNPMPESLKKIEKTLANCTDLLGEAKRSVRVPNPCLPRIRCQPKIHKEGNEMREIIAAMNSPTQRIAAWLLKEFSGMKNKLSPRVVKNSREFIEKIGGIDEIEEDELMISFDVKALYPSIPVQEAMVYLEDWLEQQDNGAAWRYKVKQYIQLARLCMTERYFIFRGTYYRCTKGVSMGNPLSGFISEVFMAKIEDKLEKEDMLPRFWVRYVDDVFAVVHKDEVDETLRNINKIHKNIKFTMEVEENGRLPFLDITVKRNQGKPEFEIYRKPTHTQRVIPSSSSHPHQHKMAAFRTMIYRMCSTPMKKEDYEKEKEYILDTARKNGYKEEIIKTMIKKEVKRHGRHQRTTLHQRNMDANTKLRAAITHDKKTTTKLRNILGKVGIEMVPTSRRSQLKNMLGTTKDRKELEEKSGIYQVACSHCEKKYIGQTKRLVTTRFKEHIGEAEAAKKKKKNSRKLEFKSAIAKHIIEEQHHITQEDLSIIKELTDWRKMEAYESLYIGRQPKEKLLNEDGGNGCSSLFIHINDQNKGNRRREQRK